MGQTVNKPMRAVLRDNKKCEKIKEEILILIKFTFRFINIFRI